MGHPKDTDDHFICVQDKRLDRMEQDIQQIKGDNRDIIKTLGGIETSIATLTTRLNYKRDKDKERNGDIKKVTMDEEEIEDKIIALEAHYQEMEKISNTTLSILKALVVAFIIFFLTFMLKTTVLGI